MKPFLILALFAILLYGLGSSLLPLILAGVGALLCEPYIEWLKNKGIKKPYSTALIIIVVFLPFLILNAILLPKMLRELGEFLAVLPKNLDKLLDQLETWAVAIGVSLDYSRQEIIKLIEDHTSEFSASIVNFLTEGFKKSVGNVTAVILTILNIFLIPIFFFYLVSENNYWRASLKALIPRDYHARLSQTMDQSVTILKSYLQGQFLACAILALIYAVGLQAVGLKFGILIGIITGALTFIPYVGFSIGMALGIIVAFSMGNGLGYVALVLAIFMIGQALESFVITPKLVGNNVGLTALESILILIIFGNLFGFAGMLIAIPTGAVIKTVLTEYTTT